jgi:hypothetical protein
MLNPSDILNALVADLQSVPALSGLAPSIVAYSDTSPNYRSLDECINSQIGNAIIVAWMGTDIGYRGSSPRWQHRFKLVLIGPGLNDDSPEDPGYFTTLTNLLNSVPPGGASWLGRTILTNLDPPDVTEIKPVRGESTTHVEISFSMLEIPFYLVSF